jgi:hypothetical protein
MCIPGSGIVDTQITVPTLRRKVPTSCCFRLGSVPSKVFMDHSQGRKKCRPRSTNYKSSDFLIVPKCRFGSAGVPNFQTLINQYDVCRRFAKRRRPFFERLPFAVLTASKSHGSQSLDPFETKTTKPKKTENIPNPFLKSTNISTMKLILPHLVLLVLLPTAQGQVRSMADR